MRLYLLETVGLHWVDYSFMKLFHKLQVIIWTENIILWLTMLHWGFNIWSILWTLLEHHLQNLTSCQINDTRVKAKNVGHKRWSNEKYFLTSQFSDYSLHTVISQQTDSENFLLGYLPTINWPFGTVVYYQYESGITVTEVSISLSCEHTKQIIYTGKQSD